MVVMPASQKSGMNRNAAISTANVQPTKSKFIITMP
jgi:hypothetical protein